MMRSPAPSWLDTPKVERAMQLLPGRAAARIESWTSSRLPGGAGICLGVWRLAGIALVGQSSIPWSIVLKGWTGSSAMEPPSTWNWPHREMELYRSGLLADLPGDIRAPHCYDTLVRDDGSIWVWLEDITDGTQPPWPIEHYGAIARRLGHFNGAWLVERHLPQTPVMGRNLLRGWTALSDHALHAFTSDPDLARASGVYPAPVLDAFQRLWRGRHAFYKELAAYPQTFCHFDAFSRNIFVRQAPDEPDDTILIDWSYAGLGAVGEDIAPLVAASVGFLDAQIADIDALADTVLRDYLVGLREAGWHGDHGDVRRVFYHSMALRYGVGAMQFALFGMIDPEGVSTIEATFGHPFDEVMSNLRAFNTWVTRKALG